jgi:uncharacterized damage-inducible protein DinB
VDSDRKILEKALGNALLGTGAHVQTQTVFAGLDWKLAGTRPEGALHSVYQLLNHMVYWQDWVVRWLDGESPPTPKHASGGWPQRAAPASRKEWERAVRHFGDGLQDLVRRSRLAHLFSRERKKSRLEMLQAIASHSSYHAGQVVLLRKLLGAWPPPSGGLTW